MTSWFSWTRLVCSSFRFSAFIFLSKPQLTAIMYRYAAFAFLLFVGVVFHQSHGIEVNVTDKDKLCLYAKLLLDFTVSYEGNKTIHTNSFKLPENATTDGSECHDNSSTLKLNFGAGHSWSINFIKNGESYQAGLVTFTYNLSDPSYFPGASSNKTMNVSQNASITDVELNTCYSCNSNEMISADQVNMTLSNVLIQAFVTSENRSENITVCAADKPITPTPANTTTAAPVTTAPTPTTPPTPLPTPQTGNYSVDSNASVCLLANFGLRIGFRLNQKYHEMNFNPVGANVSGNCGFDSSELMLESEEMIVTFTFFNDTKKFHLHTLNVTVNAGFGFNEVKTNLTLWETNIGSSYMCNKEQNSTITDKLSLYTFNLRVQPFGVQKGVFSIAYECSLDDPSILIPIIVGAALAGLILIVVIAYVIGRRKTHAGYQTL